MTDIQHAVWISMFILLTMSTARANVITISKEEPPQPYPTCETDGLHIPVNVTYSSNWFFHCSNGIPSPKKCPEGMVFSPTIQVCVLPTEEFGFTTDCVNNPPPCLNNGSCVQGACQCAEGYGGQYCESKDTAIPACNGEGVCFPHATNCSKYWQCDNGVPRPQLCLPSDKLVFNSSLDVCVWKDGEHDYCSGGAVLNAIPACNEGDAYLPHATDCSKFWQCANGVPQPKQCSSDTLVFNPNFNFCVWKNREHDTCSGSSNPAPNVCDNGQYDTYPGDYSKFLQCDNNVWKEKACPAGLWFNTSKSECDWPNCSGSCWNGGACIAHSCQCPVGFSGANCEIVNDIEEYCFNNPTAIIPDPTECHAYYNCSVTYGPWQRTFPQHKTECFFPDLFDTTTSTCKPYSQVDCGIRIETKDACNYRRNSCPVAHCIPCYVFYSSCVGVDDGITYHRYKTKSPYYVECLDERMVNTFECEQGELFSCEELKCQDAQTVLDQPDCE